MITIEVNVIRMIWRSVRTPNRQA